MAARVAGRPERRACFPPDVHAVRCATKHGLATVRAQGQSTSRLQDYFLDSLLPVGERILAAAHERGDIATEVTAYELMRGIGNLCLFAGDDARKLSHALLAGTRVVHLRNELNAQASL